MQQIEKLRKELELMARIPIFKARDKGASNLISSLSAYNIYYSKRNRLKIKNKKIKLYNQKTK